MIASLDPAALAALRMVRTAFPTQALTLIGAAALGCHIPMRWRRTQDIDLVVAVSVEDASQALSALGSWVQDPRKEHEWWAPNGACVDILPVSADALAHRVLVWPRTGHEMSLVGIRHALSAPPVPLVGGFELSVPGVAVIALLKMAAYLDRPSERERDLKDLAHILDEYPSMDDERLYGDEGILALGLMGHEAQPFLLGRELAALVDEVERAAVEGFLTRALGADLPRFVANGPWSRFEPERAESRLNALAKGFRYHPRS